MTAAQYKRMKLPELQAKRWRTTQDIRSSVARIAKGTVVTIEGKRGGFNVCTAKCPACGVQVFMRKVHFICLEEVPDGQ